MKIIHRNSMLRTITKDDIEEIRQWRNSVQVNNFLRNREHIDEHSQLRWFDSLDPNTSIYFMMEELSKPYGVIYVHDINSVEMSFEGSIFTGDSNYMNTYLPVKSIMMLFVFFFEHLSFKHLFSTVHMENSAALELNRRFGFRDIEKEGDFMHSECNREDFESHAGSLKKSLLRSSPLSIILETGDEKYPFLKSIAKT